MPGSHNEPWLAVEFRFNTSVITRGDGFVIDDGTVSKLTIDIEFAKRASEPWRPIVRSEWAPAMTSNAVGSGLETELRRRDRLAEAKVFDFPLALRNLQKGLQLALENQRLPVGQESLHGTLYEVVSEDWVVTSAGIENVRSGLLVPRESLGFDRWSLQPAKPRKIAPPEDVDERTWEYVVHRAGQQPDPNIFG